MGLTDTERTQWDEQGFVMLRGFFSPERVDELLERIVAMAAAAEDGEDIGDAMVTPESLLDDAPTPEGRLSKIFKLHRNEKLFREVCEDQRLLGKVGDILGADVDCFLSQFIFKNPGALGQPWHQDQWYFRMEPSPQVGVWLAVTEAREDNGPLWVVPGSHTEPIHERVDHDTREGAGTWYVEIQGLDSSNEIPVLMKPGDLLLFHSHLRHRSTDNDSLDMRASAVYHYADAATTTEIKADNQDWMPVIRDSRPV